MYAYAQLLTRDNSETQINLTTLNNQNINDPSRVWLESVYERCKGWQRKWEGVILHLKVMGHVRYKNHQISLDNDKITILSSGLLSYINLGDLKKIEIDHERMLFLHTHQEIIDMVRTIISLSLKDQDIISSLIKALLTQWPTDKAWESAVLDLSRKQESKADQLYQSPYYKRYLPRLLSERKGALVLIKEDGVWTTRNGASINHVLALSNPVRRQAIELLSSLPMLNRIELPPSTNFEILLPIVQEISKALNSKNVLVKRADKQKREWNLAIRRIQSMGFNGCFDAATQSVISDPRHMDSLKHELCHWLLDHSSETKEDKGQLLSKEKEVHVLEKELFG